MLSFLNRLWCAARRGLRRSIWALLAAGLLLAYSPLLDLLVRYEVGQVAPQDRAAVRAAAWGKVAEPLFFYSKTLVSVSVFTLVNLLGWAALLVVPVLVDWAIGYYKKERADFPARRGFKGTFLLELTAMQRIGVFVAVWALELFIAVESVRAGFAIQ